jgi:hypothetical protein
MGVDGVSMPITLFSVDIISETSPVPMWPMILHT